MESWEVEQLYGQVQFHREVLSFLIDILKADGHISEVSMDDLRHDLQIVEKDLDGHIRAGFANELNQMIDRKMNTR